MKSNISSEKRLLKVAWGAYILFGALLSVSCIAFAKGGEDLSKSGDQTPQVPADAFIFDSGTQQVTLLELFSSQGCSSCPPAEQWMSLLKTDQRLWKTFIPLVFHVDYWDYLGWKDPYASIKHSQRQRMYQLHGHCKAVYTPGFILGGEEWTDWFHTRMLPELPSKAAGQLKVEVNDSKVQARFVQSQDNRGLHLNVALLGFNIVTEVKKGENKGKTLPQDFVVLSYRSFASDQGIWKVSMPQSEFQGKTAAVFWVNRGSDPAPLQAAGGWYQTAVTPVSGD
ncbi:DUF1223 domain-containing protein [Pseudomaricurvus sp.]|uniref:DUF1223 domain-containing protein n=1 Tax=Pseudomaricurvus sp. TaxID=2004510 RepID=UPI003F6B7895